MKKSRVILIAGATLGLTAIGATQIGQVLKAGGVFLVVKTFGKDINKAINKLDGHSDSDREITKVVPILSGGINGRKAVGAAQVIGPRSQVDKVQAVAQLDQDIFGGELKIRAMIPIESKDVIKDIKRVEGVGVSGIVDLKIRI